jgi:hypothetical protein
VCVRVCVCAPPPLSSKLSQRILGFFLADPLTNKQLPTHQLQTLLSVDTSGKRTPSARTRTRTKRTSPKAVQASPKAVKSPRVKKKKMMMSSNSPTPVGFAPYVTPSLPRPSSCTSRQRRRAVFFLSLDYSYTRIFLRWVHSTLCSPPYRTPCCACAEVTAKKTSPRSPRWLACPMAWTALLGNPPSATSPTSAPLTRLPVSFAATNGHAVTLVDCCTVFLR